MSFTLTDVDNKFVNEFINISLDRVDDVANHLGNDIVFQFPPIIRSDKKSGKWKELYNTFGYEPKYMYQGANPRHIQIEAVYIIGGPPIGEQVSTLQNIMFQIRTWKKYFYIKSANRESGGIKSGAGSDLPIWRIFYMGNDNGFIGIGDRQKIIGSSWRCLNYNIKYSDEWIIDGGDAHPLVTTITVDLAMATGVDVTGRDNPKQRHNNIANKPFVEWY